MFVLSGQQLCRLIPLSFPTPSLILDIGSGDGHVTDQLKTLGATIQVTEASTIMQRVLQKKGYQ